MLKIIIPLAGSSELFSNSGYYYPKPLIEIHGKTMIELVLDNPSKMQVEHKFIFIVKEDDINNFHLDNTLKLLRPGCDVIPIKNVAKGALCSVLMAVDKLDTDDSILILNGDQIIDIDFTSVLNFWISKKSECGLVTFKSVHPRWSYARIDDEDCVLQTAEKNPISHSAIAGYYYFSDKDIFLKAAFQSIKDNSQLDGIFYISPVVNQLILMNKDVSSFAIDSSAYHSFYSPQMVSEFERKN